MSHAASSSGVTTVPHSYNPSRRRHLLFILALVGIAGTVFFGQLLLQRPSACAEADGRLINLAGRQRALSQRVCNLALQLPAASPVAPARPLRLLLAEGTVVNQRLGMRMLERLGHSVTVAVPNRSGSSAVAARLEARAGDLRDTADA